MTLFRPIALALVVVPLSGVFVPAFATEIGDLLAKQNCNPSTVGILVKQLENDSTLYAGNAESLFIPASVQKLVTGAAAYEKLGPTYMFKTRVYIDGTLRADSGIVPGNLYIRGGGDPGFLVERLWLFARQLSLQGIRTIKGDLLLDDSFFDSVQVGPGFAEDQTSRPYESMVGPLSGSFNTITVYYRPAESVGSPVLVDFFPLLEGLKLESGAKTIAAGSATTVEVRSTAGPGGGTKIVLSGGMALDAKTKFSYVKTWGPALSFGNELKPLFTQCGITVRGSVRMSVVPDSLLAIEPFYVFESLPLFDFIRYMFKYSNNFAAEMLFKTMAAEQNGGKSGSWPIGAQLMKEWWKENRLPGELAVVNGSGMGKEDRISPYQLVELLDHVWHRQDYFPDYMSLMPVAGIDGTLKSRFKKSRLKGIVRAKTGSLNSYGSSTLAGYALYPGKTYAFAILFNNKAVDQYQTWVLSEKILELLLP